MPHVDVPPPYRGPTRGEAIVAVDGATVGECLREVGERYAGFHDQIFDNNGDVHRFVSLFVNGDEIGRGELATPLSPDDELKILAAIAGG